MARVEQAADPAGRHGTSPWHRPAATPAGGGGPPRVVGQGWLQIGRLMASRLSGPRHERAPRWAGWTWTTDGQALTAVAAATLQSAVDAAARQTTARWRAAHRPGGDRDGPAR